LEHPGQSAKSFVGFASKTVNEMKKMLSTTNCFLNFGCIRSRFSNTMFVQQGNFVGFVF
jgi:hypothetical protein